MLGDSLLAGPAAAGESEDKEPVASGRQLVRIISHKKYEGGRRIESDGEERFPVYLRAGHGACIKGPCKGRPGCRYRKWNRKM